MIQIVFDTSFWAGFVLAFVLFFLGMAFAIIQSS